VNLCVNAVDAMPESGTLGLQSLDLRDGWVELRVKDTGTGMSKEVLSRAMEPFFTTKDQGKGTGLGLAMVYSTVQAHHGQVHIQSELGKGTCVVIRIPAGVSPPDLRGKPADGSAQAASQSLRILVVDDDELVQDSMVNLLRIMGHAATLASRGEEALDLLEAGLAPHLVILDRNMPGLDGLGTLQRLRLRWPDLPVLIATGNADQAVMDLVASDPETHLLNKPFENKDLSLVLGQWAGLLGA